MSITMMYLLLFFALVYAIPFVLSYVLCWLFSLTQKFNYQKQFVKFNNDVQSK
jgi:hypothetical protein